MTKSTLRKVQLLNFTAVKLFERYFAVMSRPLLKRLMNGV